EPDLFRGLAGFHPYLGTNVDREESLIAQFATAVATARRLAKSLSLEPLVLDLGGGFAAPFGRRGGLPKLPTLASALTQMLDRAFPGWRQGRPRVAFESGRYLTATRGPLLTRAADVNVSY